MSRRPAPIGLDWAAVTASYVAHGGELQPEVWKRANSVQAGAPKAAKESSGRPSHNPLGRGAVVELTRAQIQDVATRYAGGEPSPSIAASYGIASNTVLRLLRDEGVEIRDLRKVVAPVKIPALIERYYAGETMAELAAAEGVGSGVMSRTLVAAGLQMRSRSEARSMASQVRRGAAG